MERLTTRTSIMGRKHDIAYGCASIWKKKLKNDKYELIENVVDKLGQLEDIEQELGIDLITLIIAFRKGIYDLENGKWYSFSTYELYIDNRLNIHNRKNGKVYHFADKGISWCLTKEELEKKIWNKVNYKRF